MFIFSLMLVEQEDEDKFTRFYIVHKRAMYNIAFGILNNRADAEDATQDAFFSIAKHMDRLKNLPDNEMKAYAVITVKNAAAAIIRKRRGYKETGDDIMSEIDDDFIVQTIYDEDAYREIIKIIREMDEKYRSALYLRYVENYTYAEIALRLHIKETTVKAQLYRGTEILRNKIKERGLI